MRRGRLAMAVVAMHAVPALAATDVTSVAEAGAPAAAAAVTFSGVLSDSSACSGSDCFTGTGAVTLAGDEAPISAIESGVISAIAAWTDNPEPILGGEGEALLAETGSGAGGFVVDLDSFSLSAALLTEEGMSLLGEAAAVSGIDLALLDTGVQTAPEAEWASACGASNESAVAVTLASIATGCPVPPARYAGVLSNTSDLSSDFTQNLWDHGDPAGLLSDWFFFFSPPPAVGGSGGGGSSWAISLPGVVRAPLGLSLPGGSLLPALPALAPALGFAPLLANSAPAVSEAPSAAVPEPGTWALLITGFAMTGAVLRRRKAARA